MGAGLTERQQKWFASVRASLERETGRSLAEWIEIAKTCPESKSRARLAWFKEHHGLGQNRASYVLSEAFPSPDAWDDPEGLRAALWTDPAAAEILTELEAAVAALPDVVTGQRKGYTAFSRKVQFAAARPLKGGKVMLGLALDAGADPRLGTPKNEAWSERLKARMPIEGAAEIDDSLRALLKAAWERS